MQGSWKVYGGYLCFATNRNLQKDLRVRRIKNKINMR